MTIGTIKDIIGKNINKELSFKISGSRNQIEEFNGKIIKVYNSVFLIKDKNSGISRSFTYSDILTKNLTIYQKK